MPAPARKKYIDFQGYTDDFLSQISPEEAAQFDDLIDRAHSERPKAFGGGERAMRLDVEAAELLRQKLGISREQAMGLVQLRSGVRHASNDNVKDGSALFSKDIAPGDYATDEEYQAALLGEFGLPVMNRKQAEEADAGAAAEAAKAEVDRNDVTGRIQRFIDSMTGPSRSDDPVRMALIQAGTDAAQANAGARGVRGGLANTAAASVAQANLLPYEAQRASLAAQGIGMLNNRDLSLAQLRQADEHFITQRNDMMAQEKWKAQMGQSQAIGGAIGTGLGALGFIGGPALGAATMGAGGAIGGALGGMFAPQQSPQYSLGQPRPTQSPYRRGGNGTGF